MDPRSLITPFSFISFLVSMSWRHGMISTFNSETSSFSFHIPTQFLLSLLSFLILRCHSWTVSDLADDGSACFSLLLPIAIVNYCFPDCPPPFSSQSSNQPQSLSLSSFYSFSMFFPWLSPLSALSLVPFSPFFLSASIHSAQPKQPNSHETP